jgi:hypothetical protein
MQGRRLLPSALAAALLIAPAGADARSLSARLPSSTVTGVSVAGQKGGSVTIRFSRASSARRAYALLEGQRVRVTCTDFTSKGGTVRGHTQLDLPRRFSLIRLNGLDNGYEVCSLSRPKHPRIVVLALDVAGRQFLGDVRAIGTVRGVATQLRVLAHAAPDGHYPSAPAFADRDRRRYAVLAHPRDAAPAGRIGIYSDGRSHASVVYTSPSGRRFFYEIEGASVQTNVTPVQARVSRLDG